MSGSREGRPPGTRSVLLDFIASGKNCNNLGDTKRILIDRERTTIIAEKLGNEEGRRQAQHG
jgi:hypothetical protein